MAAPDRPHVPREQPAQRRPSGDQSCPTLVPAAAATACRRRKRLPPCKRRLAPTATACEGDWYGERSPRLKRKGVQQPANQDAGTDEACDQTRTKLDLFFRIIAGENRKHDGNKHREYDHQ